MATSCEPPNRKAIYALSAKYALDLVCDIHTHTHTIYAPCIIKCHSRHIANINYASIKSKKQRKKFYQHFGKPKEIEIDLISNLRRQACTAIARVCARVNLEKRKLHCDRMRSFCPMLGRVCAKLIIEHSIT